MLTPSPCRPGGLQLMFLCSRCLLGLGLSFSAHCQEPHPCLGDPLRMRIIGMGDSWPWSLQSPDARVAVWAAWRLHTSLFHQSLWLSLCK